MPDIPGNIDLISPFLINEGIPVVPQGEGNMGADLREEFLTKPQQVLAMRAENRRLDDVHALLYEHPDYTANREKWDKYMNLYAAEDVYQYIYQHPRETEESWTQRVQRAYYYNYTASIIDLIVSYLFSVNITREPSAANSDSDDSEASVESPEDKELKQELQPIFQDADLRGTSYDVFIRMVATFAQVLGHVGVLVDAPNQDAAQTEQDVKDQGIRPYLKLVLPMNLLDWSIDEFGEYEWVKIEVPPVENRSFHQKLDGAERNFLIWTRTNWELWQVIDIPGEDKIATKLSEGDSPASIRGTVPFAIFKNGRKVNHDWFGDSAVRDIADINIALMNWASLGDEEIANRCLNIMTMERDQQNQIAALISHCNILEYSPGSQPPQYLQPGETPLKLIGEWMNRARDEIYRLAKMGGSTGLLGVREATSGIAYAYEFNETNQSLTAKAAFMEEAETKVFRLIAKWVGKEFTGTVCYARDFGVDDFLLELDTIMKARMTLTSPSAIRQMEKNFSRKLFARNSLKFRQTVDTEIDKAEPIPLPLDSFGTVPSVLTSGKAGGGSAGSQ